MPPEGIHVLVLLRAGSGGLSALRAYEASVLPYLEDHGGAVLSAFEPEVNQGPETPDEVHLLSFPSREAFGAFRSDPRVQALAAERESAIAGTTVYTSARRLQY